MSKRTKALAISKSVKERVFERDRRQCIFCGSPHGLPEAHYIPRSQSGLGVPENVVTLCRTCHYLFDFSPQREKMKDLIRDYLKSCYPEWDEEKLRYKRGI